MGSAFPREIQESSRSLPGGFSLSDYDYALPKELIAQDPLADRASSRLMVVDRRREGVEHRVFSDLPEYLRPGDCLVLNDTKVIPARLLGRRLPREERTSSFGDCASAAEGRPSGKNGSHEAGGVCEFLLLKQVSHPVLEEAPEHRNGEIYSDEQGSREMQSRLEGSENRDAEGFSGSAESRGAEGWLGSTENRDAEGFSGSAESRGAGSRSDGSESQDTGSLSGSAENPDAEDRPGKTGSEAVLHESFWECLVKPGKRLRVGDRAVFGEGLLFAEVIKLLPDGLRLVRFTFQGVFQELLDRLGQMPLPPYIQHQLKDKDRYQTVYAKNPGSAAAPTAGLHFTEELLQRIEKQGVSIAKITLHVGLGTFRPVKEQDIREHLMHSEWFSVGKDAAEKINRARAQGGRVICVGTTSCRTLESAAAMCLKQGASACPESPAAKLAPCSGNTTIFIYPGYQFLMTNALITNFHLPESTLLMLVSALAGRERILAAYREAVRQEYRFFSFGDAMLIL